MLRFICVVLAACCFLAKAQVEVARLNPNIALLPKERLVIPDLRIPALFLDPRKGGKSGNPGLKLQLTRKGLDYANRVASGILNKEIRELDIPDVHKSISGGYVKATGISITSYNPPRFYYQLHPSDRFTWGLNNGKIAIKGRWKGRKKVTFIPISGSGSFTASASGVNIRLTARLRTKSGKPQMDNVQCSARLNLSVKIKGGIVGWVLNLFRGKIADRLEPVLQDEICKQAKKFVTNDVNAKLRTLPTSVSLLGGFKLNYALQGHPAVTSSYVETKHKGEVSYQGQGGTPFHPHNLVGSPSNSKMLYLRGSDYVLNSFLHAAHKRQASKYTISRRKLPNIAKYLRFTCPGDICLGTLYPKVAQQHPNARGEILVQTTSDPIAVFSTGKARLSGRGKLQVYAVSGSQRISLVKVNVRVSAELTAQITSSLKVTGKAKITDLKLTLDNPSSPGSRLAASSSLSKALTNDDLKLLATLAKPMLEEQANKYLSKGFPLPVTKGVKFVNPKVKFLTRTLEISTDVAYTG